MLGRINELFCCIRCGVFKMDDEVMRLVFWRRVVYIR